MMNCPRCGAGIEESQKFCPDCGYSLRVVSPKNDSDPTSQPSLRKTVGLSKPSFDSASVSLSADKPVKQRPSSDTKPIPIPPRVELPKASGAEQSGNPGVAKASLSAADNVGTEGPFTASDMDSDVRTDRASRKTIESSKDKKGRTSGKKKKKKPVSKALKIFIAVFIVAILVGGGIGTNAYVRANYKTWPRMFKVVFGIGKTVAYPATVEEVIGTDGFPAHKFTVKGDNPDVLIVHMLNNQRITFINGFATITIPDSYFIAQNVQDDAETITQNIQLAILDNQNKETPVPCDPVVIKVPQTVVQNLVPQEDTVEVYQTSVTLSMNVLANSSVTINGQDESAGISNNAFSKSLPVVMGTNTFEIIVKTPYYRSFKKTLTVNRVLPPVSITVSPKPVSRTEAKTLTISGTAEKNATLKLVGKGSLSYTKATGVFTIKLTMNSLGLYEGTLSATLSGKNQGVYSFRVERIPNATEYQKAAKTPDLNTLFSKMSTFVNSKLKLSGTVSNIEGDTFTLALGNNQSLTFSYYGDTPIIIGDAVTVYGEIQKLTNSVPTCYAWFVVH